MHLNNGFHQPGDESEGIIKEGLRETFAMIAMEKIMERAMVNTEKGLQFQPDKIAHSAWAMADAMMEHKDD